MSLIVQKYGGTSVENIDRIKNVARRVIETKRKGHDVVVVVSAMAGETNRLIALAQGITGDPNRRELDQLVSTGEQVTIALLALALQDMDQPARSFVGHQVKITTDSSYSKARIKSIDAKIVKDCLKKGEVVIVAGFQGIDEEGNITTLGRGGSDTTAMALSAALKADLCEIYTDVDGVYTTDPRICPDARKLEKITYEEMLELASTGARVLQIRSVEFAAKYGVNLVVRSSFNHHEGTLVCKEDKKMEEVIVSGIALEKGEAKVALRRVPDRPGVAIKVFGPIAASDINVDMIVQNISEDGHTDLTFTMPRADLSRARKIIEGIAPEIGLKRVDADEDIAKVSIVGVGMRSHAGVAAKVFETLSNKKINIEMISTSEIKISVVVKKDKGEEAVRALHAAFELGGKRG
ncbi:MAG: aspartate kinase [Deltaproteobacteria bacterium]|nr:aspartate kinase [Deltaproteobacteria bacterium]